MTVASVGPLDVPAFPLPEVAYRHEQERWFFEIGTAGVLLLQGARIEVGARF